MPSNKCPTCGYYDPGSSPIINCRDPWHRAEPELMFAFHSRKVSETELRRAIEDARRHPYAPRPIDYAVLASAAELMIDGAKAPAPDHLKVRLGHSTGGVRAELEDMLLANGLDPAKYLRPLPGGVTMTKEPSSVCLKPDEPTSNQIAEQAARELATMLYGDLGVSVTPILLRLWLIERWNDVTPLAHKIHASK